MFVFVCVCTWDCMSLDVIPLNEYPIKGFMTFLHDISLWHDMSYNRTLHYTRYMCSYTIPFPFFLTIVDNTLIT